MSASPALLRNNYYGTRKNGGMSLRQFLISQGVTSEHAMKTHLAVISETISANPRFNPRTDYKINPNYPNGPALQG